MDQEAKFLVLADYFCTTLASATQFKKIRNVNKYKILVENTYYVLQQTLKSFKKYIPQRIQESSVAVDKSLVLANKLMATRTRDRKWDGNSAEIEECLKPPEGLSLECEFYFLSPEEVAMEAEECAKIVFPNFGLTTKQRPSQTTRCGKEAKGDITCPLDDKREAEWYIRDRKTLEMARRYWLFYSHDCECDWCVFVAAQDFEDMNMFPPASPHLEENGKDMDNNDEAQEEKCRNMKSQLAESTTRIKLLEDGLKEANDTTIRLHELAQYLVAKFENDLLTIREESEKQRHDLSKQVQNLEQQNRKLEVMVAKLEASDDKEIDPTYIDATLQENNFVMDPNCRNPCKHMAEKYDNSGGSENFGEDKRGKVKKVIITQLPKQTSVPQNANNNKHRESSLKQPRIKQPRINNLTLDALRKNDSLDDRSQQIPNHKSPKIYKAWKLKPADKGGGIGERGWIEKWSRFLQAVT